MSKNIISPALSLIAICLTCMPCFSQHVTVVTASHLNSWEISVAAPSSINFTDNLPNPPSGCGSAELYSNSGELVRLRKSDLKGTLLENISSLSYYTMVTHSNYENIPDNIEAPYMALYVKASKPGSDINYNIIFSPRYQSGKFIANYPTLAQPKIEMNKWQKWDARNGLWWVVNQNLDPDQSISELQPLDVFIANQKSNGYSLTLESENNNGVSMRVSIGAKIIIPRWQNFKANVDAIRIKTQSADTLYDLEKDYIVAGNDTSVCRAVPFQIGSQPIPGVTYSWKATPSSNNNTISDNTVANPIVTPITPTTYTLTAVTANGCKITRYIIVSMTPVAECKPLSSRWWRHPWFIIIIICGLLFGSYLFLTRNQQGSQ